jgi:hypothetical protein
LAPEPKTTSGEDLQPVRLQQKTRPKQIQALAAAPGNFEQQLIRTSRKLADDGEIEMGAHSRCEAEARTGTKTWTERLKLEEKLPRSG